MRTVLALIDFATSTPRLVDAAAEMAALLGGRVVLLHVAMPFTVGLASEPPNHLRRDVLAKVFRGRHRELRRMRRELCQRGVDATAKMARGRSMFANPIAVILRVAGHLRPELIVATPHRRGRIGGALTRGVTRALGRRAPCPVLLVPEGS